MYLLVTRAAKTLLKYEHPNLGRLIQPRHFGAEKKWPGIWAADNDCFQGLDAPAYHRMLLHIARVRNDRLLWVTVPDVVGDCAATRGLFRVWEPRLSVLGLPAAYVAQDGETRPPWHAIKCLFIGGTTEWKMGLSAARLAREAKERGKLVHMGRVNSTRRIRYAQSLGCDSIDGSSFSMFADTYIPDVLKWLSHEQSGLAL